MDERSKKVLFAVVQSYINAPVPVGSRFLLRRHGFNISSATIRNTMADLEEMGYLSQPHTSAGRIPTDKGYRLYIERILNNKVASDIELLSKLYINLVEMRGELDEFLDMATKTLSDYSHYLGVALSTCSEQSILKKIELFHYKDNKIAVILLTENVIRHKIIEIESESALKQKDLSRIASYINAEFAGYPLGEIRGILLDTIYKEKSQCDDLIAKALMVCKYVVFSLHEDIYISGLSELLDLPDFSDIQKIKDLSKAIEDKQAIITLLDKIVESEGVQVYIGSESSLYSEDLSLVASNFYEKDRPVGVLGLIGPKRMNYLNAITIVDTTAKCLSQLLEKR